MPAEAYIKGDTVLVVHMRRRGRVYGHTQRADDRFVYWVDFFSISEEAFADAVAGVAPYDVRKLSATQEPACWSPAART